MGLELHGQKVFTALRVISANTARAEYLLVEVYYTMGKQEGGTQDERVQARRRAVSYGQWTR